MSYLTTQTATTQASPDESEIVYNRHSHMFDVFYCGEKIAEEACYGDGEASLLIYRALREAEEAQADSAYRRERAARYVLQAYPQACYIGWRVATQALPPLTQPHIIVTLPTGYAVHAVLNGTFGALIERVTL